MAAALVIAWVAVDKGRHHRRLLELPSLPWTTAKAESAGLPVEVSQSGKLLAALAAAGRAGTSVVDVRTPTRHGAGFVAWTDAQHSYVLTARPVVARDVRRGQRNVEVWLGDTAYAGRVLVSDPASELALVRVRGRLARALLSTRAGELEPGRVAVSVSVLDRKRVQSVDLRLTPAGNLRARGKRIMPIGSPVLLLNGHLGGIVVRGGRDAVVLPLALCRDRVRCFGPRLP